MDKSPLVIYDRRKSRDGALLLAGVDEAGRGCWAGPVVAAAVILTDDGCPPGLNDSKQLSRRRREAVFQHIITSALSWGACAVSARRIDETDILRATLEAMSIDRSPVCGPGPN